MRRYSFDSFNATYCRSSVCLLVNWIWKLKNSYIKAGGHLRTPQAPLNTLLGGETPHPQLHYGATRIRRLVPILTVKNIALFVASNQSVPFSDSRIFSYVLRLGEATNSTKSSCNGSSGNCFGESNLDFKK